MDVQGREMTAEPHQLAALTRIRHGSARRSDVPRHLGGPRLRSFRDGEAHIVALAGHFELATLTEVERELEQVECSDARIVVLDLRELEFFDSIELQIVTMAQRHARSRLVVVHGSQCEQRAFAMGHLRGLRAAEAGHADGERPQADQQPADAPVEGGARAEDRPSSGAFRWLRARWRTSFARMSTSSTPR